MIMRLPYIVLLVVSILISPNLAAQGTWTTASLSKARAYLSGACAGTKCLFAGGYDGTYTNRVDIYDNATGTWTQSALSAPRAFLCAVASGTKIYFAGGWDGTTAFDLIDIYDTSTDQWTVDRLKYARASLTATALGTKIFFGGGGSGSTYFSAVEIYDTSTSLWSEISLPSARVSLAATANGTKVFFAGGHNGITIYDGIDIYDVNTGLWTKRTIATPRQLMGATSVGNKSFFAGGSTDVNGNSLSNVIDVYDYSTNQWTNGTLSVARWLAAVSLGPFAVFGGGGSSGSSGSSRVDIYNNVTGLWSTTDYSDPRYANAAGAVGNKVLFAGGWINNGTTSKSTVDILDLAPWVSSYFPQENATGVQVTSNLVLTFSKTVTIGSGNIFIKEGTNIVQTIAITDASQVSVSGNVITINPKIDLGGIKSISILIDAGAIKDLAGNSYSGITSSAIWVFTTAADLTPPSVTITSTSANPTNLSPITVTFNFTESVTGFGIDDIVTNGTVTSLTGSGTTYTATITLSVNEVVTINVPSGAFADAAGNNNTAASNTLSRTFDNVSPSVEITSTANNVTYVSPIPVTVTFTESVTDFFVDDITVTNGTIAGFMGSGTTYTFNVTPTPNSSVTVTVSVAAAKATDAAGNTNTVSNTLTRTYDTVAPTVTISSSSTNVTNTSPITVTFTFSENVTGFGTGDIIVTNGTVTENSFSGSGTTYTATITPDLNGVVTIKVLAGTFADIAGNNNTTASNTLSRTFDNVAPTVVIASSAPDPTNAILPITITFSEGVTGFNAGIITVTNGSIETSPVNSTTYSATITPTISKGTVTVSIPAGKIADPAGNANTISNTLSRDYDSVSPTVTITSTALNPTSTSPIPITIVFSESVTGFDAGDIVTNGEVTVVNFPSSGTTYTANITPTSLGEVTVNVAAGKAVDAAGNTNTVSNTLTRTYSLDSTPPQINPDNTPTEVDFGASLLISAQITDAESAITEAKVEYRSIGNKSSNTIAENLILSTNNTYSLTIPANEIGSIGVEYKISATSTGGILTTGTSFKVVKVRFPSDGLSIPYSSGSDVSNYRIIAVPVELDNKKVSDVFNELMPLDINSWRLFHYDEGGSSTSKKTTELSGSSSIEPGLGYWLIVRDNKGTVKSGDGTAVSATTNSPFEISIKAGFNQIGNPYNFDLLWSDVQDLNPGLPGLTIFDGDPSEYYKRGTTLPKMQGGFVKVNFDMKLKFPVKNNGSGGRIKGSDATMLNALTSQNWEIPLIVRQGDRMNSTSGIGMNEKASDGFDRYDMFNIPRFFDRYLELHHTKKDGSDIYSNDVVPRSDQHEWEFSVVSTLGDPIIQLEWNNEYFGDNDQELYLWDVKNSRAIDMRTANQYVYDKSAVSSFKIFYGKSTFIKEKTQVESVVIHELFPNPANEDLKISFTLPESLDKRPVLISMMDMMGRSHWSFQHAFKGGYHEVVWKRDGETSGIYIISVQSGSTMKQFKVILK